MHNNNSLIHCMIIHNNNAIVTHYIKTMLKVFFVVMHSLILNIYTCRIYIYTIYTLIHIQDTVDTHTE